MKSSSLALISGILALHLLCISSACAANPAAAAAFGPAPQDSSIAGFGPLDPSQPTGLTPQQIIDKFGARELTFSKARESYTFTQTVTVNTISEDNGRPDGEYKQVINVTFDKDGRRAEHVLFAPQNTLTRVMMSPSDMEDIEHRLPFILTTPELPQYIITYAGKQKVDDLDTYVFDVKPKVIEKNKRYFQGKIWVDQQDTQIVLVNGKNVPDDTRPGHEDLSPPFTTYYEQIDGKYWFPTYTKGEGVLHFVENGLRNDVHLRSKVQYTDYKQFHASSRIIYNGQDITDNKAEPDSTTPGTAAPGTTAPAKK